MLYHHVGVDMSRKPTIVGANRYREEGVETVQPKSLVFDDDDDKAGPAPMTCRGCNDKENTGSAPTTTSPGPIPISHGSVPSKPSPVAGKPIRVSTQQVPSQAIDPFGVDEDDEVMDMRDEDNVMQSPPSIKKRTLADQTTPLTDKKRVHSDSDSSDKMGRIEQLLANITDQLSIQGKKIDDLETRIDNHRIPTPDNDLSIGSVPPQQADEATLKQWLKNQGTYPRLVRELMFMLPGGTRRERAQAVERVIRTVYGYTENSSQSQYLLSRFLLKLRQLKQYIKDIVGHPFVKDQTANYIDIHKEALDSPTQAATVWSQNPPQIMDDTVASSVIGKIKAVMTRGNPIFIQNTASFDKWCLFIVSINMLSIKSDDKESDHDVYSIVTSAIFPTTRFNHLSSRPTTPPH